MIHRILSALESQDYLTLSQCFARDGQYIDYCPGLNGDQNYFVYGREAIEMFFRNRFVNMRFVVGSVRAESASEGTYFGSYHAPYVYARVRIEKTDDSGLVEKLVVTPA